jgi:hypothetical protein
MTVTEYRDRFLQLTRYAPAEVAHDGDKQERFREGLDDHLEYALMNHRFDNFNQLVDAALNTERKRREIEDKKRKIEDKRKRNPFALRLNLSRPSSIQCTVLDPREVRVGSVGSRSNK